MNSFFFSSRRRHTRYWRDWSSDVCSSDLMSRISHTRSTNDRSRSISFGGCVGGGTTISLMIVPGDDENTYTRSPRYTASSRSEERRVGKEYIDRTSLCH